MEIEIRFIREDELPALLDLYRILHPEDPAIEVGQSLLRQWGEILRDPRIRYVVAEATAERAIVSTCTITLIPNLTRGARPYGVIENVVTDPRWRKRGVGTRVLRAALVWAWENRCYKVMLMTGSKDPATLRFYDGAGFWRGTKTAFVATPPPPAADGSTELFG